MRGRVGYLVTPTLLLYGTGGFAYGQRERFQRSNTSTGWTAGGGVEWLFAPHWSAKAEYLYVDLSSSGSTAPIPAGTSARTIHPQINVVRAGVNYHFNWGAPAPVVAKYLIGGKLIPKEARPSRPGFLFKPASRPDVR